MTHRKTRAFTCGAVAFLTASFAAGHGFVVKPCYNAEESLRRNWLNAKTNATVRGAVSGGEANQLYMMDPQLNHTGVRIVGGYRAVMQDEEASTIEFAELSFVRYDTGGVRPVEGPAGVILKSTYAAFGVFSGQVSYDFLFTIGNVVTLTDVHHGIGLLLPANPAWPADGLSVQAQLNLPGHPLRPRVTPPYDQQEWAFERPASQAQMTRLGGRTLDTLQMMAVWAIEPILQTYVISDAYGNGSETLFGPESLHPVRARGDALGFYLQGGNDGQNGTGGTAYFMLSPTLAASPFQFAPAVDSNWFYLGFTGASPVLLMTGNPDPQHGRLMTPAIPFRWFPPAVTDFWVQALLHYPATGLVRLTDACGVKGV